MAVLVALVDGQTSRAFIRYFLFLLTRAMFSSSGTIFCTVYNVDRQKMNEGFNWMNNNNNAGETSHQLWGTAAVAFDPSQMHFAKKKTERKSFSRKKAGGMHGYFITKVLAFIVVKSGHSFLLYGDVVRWNAFIGVFLKCHWRIIAIVIHQHHRWVRAWPKRATRQAVLHVTIVRQLHPLASVIAWAVKCTRSVLLAIKYWVGMVTPRHVDR